MSDEVWFAVLLGIATIFGVRGSWRLSSRFRAARHGEGALTDKEQLLLGSIVVVAWFLTAFSLYLGILSIRRMLGFDPLAFTAPITTVLAMVVLLIPAGLDLVVDWIAKSGQRQ